MRLRVPTGLTRSFGKVVLKIRSNAPEILMVTGAVSTFAGFIWGCVSSTKLEATVDRTKEKIDTIKEYAEQHPDEVTEREVKKDIRKARTEGVVEVAKLYLPSIGLVGAGYTSMFASHGLLRRNEAMLASACAALQASYSAYRQRVVDAVGEEAEQKIRLGYEEKTIVEPDENNHPISRVEKEIDPATLSEVSRYAVFFDGRSPYYRYITRKTVVGVDYIPDTEENFIFLKNVQNAMNNKLKTRGYLFLNEVYRALGLPCTIEGQLVGWIFEKDNAQGDNKVDFGLFNTGREATRRFVEGIEDVVLLDFNVDGYILDRFRQAGHGIY